MRIIDSSETVPIIQQMTVTIPPDVPRLQLTLACDGRCVGWLDLDLQPAPPDDGMARVVFAR